ncbi:hypothetical protein BDA99DRAFT_531199 [Phascolomyces articulosus]|uniref:Disease resistance R13L4/SHOC-2-like LRR domain-containing protein n=1 Tax=Phascolomyces articulosus TaxID=60185 RepID=A0AAD5PJ86_9FUNG|nr:hypothetical protein BDA99DRAFT_531199 [Phascolomyces articulosus]
MQKRSSLQPRPTKASMLRQQGQQQTSPRSTTPVSSTPTLPPPTTTTNKRNSKVQASEGIRAFMAAQRAVAAQRKKTTEKEETPQENSRSRIRVMTGANRYSYDDNDPFGMGEQKPNLKLQTLIRQAKSSGKLNLANRHLDRVPDEVWSMYHVDPNKIVVDFSSTDDAWYDSTELNKLIISDNSITDIDERLGQEFGALTLLDCRNNQLEKLPESLRQLQQLTVLHLSHNQIQTFPESIFDLERLRDLDLSHNQLTVVPPTIKRLGQLETLDLNDNLIQEVADEIGHLVKLRKLYLNQNQLVQLPLIHHLKNLKKLEELHLFKNQLRVLFVQEETGGAIELPSLSRLDVRQNNLAHIMEWGKESLLSLPKLKEMLLAMNHLSQASIGFVSLLKNTPHVQTLDISSNLFSEIPDAVIHDLSQLQRLDVSANHLRQLRNDLGQLKHLQVLSWEGNPLRSAPRNVSMAELIESLRSKMVLDQQEQGEEQEEAHDDHAAHHASAAAASTTFDPTTTKVPSSSSMDVVNPMHSPAPPKRASGTLDLSQKRLSELDPSELSSITTHPATLQLHHNMFDTIPMALFDHPLASTLVALDLDHNRIKTLSLTTLENTHVFPSLQKVSLSNNRITTLSFHDKEKDSFSLVFPQLIELNISINQLTQLPENLRDYLPRLRTLKANTNRIDKIIPQTLEGLEIIDLGNNDIGQLPPEIGRIETIRELILYGNRFRIPRPAVLDQGTRAVLEFLRRRLQN